MEVVQDKMVSVTCSSRCSSNSALDRAKACIEVELYIMNTPTKHVSNGTEMLRILWQKERKICLSIGPLRKPQREQLHTLIQLWGIQCSACRPCKYKSSRSSIRETDLTFGSTVVMSPHLTDSTLPSLPQDLPLFLPMSLHHYNISTVSWNPKIKNGELMLNAHRPLPHHQFLHALMRQRGSGLKNFG